MNSLTDGEGSGSGICTGGRGSGKGSGAVWSHRGRINIYVYNLNCII